MRNFIIISLIGLIACNSTDSNTKSLSVNDTIQAARPAKITTDSSVYILDTAVTSNFSGDTVNQISKTLKLISDFDKASVHFPRDSFLVYEKTTEGCEIIAVNNKPVGYIELYGTLFGEMGKSEFQYYLLNGSKLKLSCVIFTYFTYNKPMYQKDMQIKRREMTYQIYSENKLIAVLDGNKKKQNISSAKFKVIENDTRQFFEDYIGQIKIAR